MANGQKLFGVQRLYKKSYSVIIYGIKQTLYWVMTIFIPSISLSFIWRELGRLPITVKIKIKIVSQMKEKDRFPITLLLKTKIINTMKEIGKIYSITGIKIKIISTFRAIIRVPATIKVTKIKLIANPTLAQFIQLLIYDPQTLGTLDIKTLGQMDAV